MTQETYHVSGMHCLGCGRAIKKYLEKNAHVQSVMADSLDTTIVVTYDDAKLDQTFILEAVGRFGYTAVKKETT